MYCIRGWLTKGEQRVGVNGGGGDMEGGMGRGGGRQVKGVVKNNRVGCGGGVKWVVTGYSLQPPPPSQ